MVLFSGLLALVPVGIYVYCSIAAERDLQAAIREVEQLDPRWRLEDVEGDRAQVPDERNAAVTVLKARGLVPAPWPA
jgi:hypothetical protein